MVTQVAPPPTVRLRSLGQALERLRSIRLPSREGLAPSDARFYLGRARRALDRGDVHAAEREASKALQHDDVSPWPYVTLARCALAQHHRARALLHLRQAQARAPRNGYVLRLMEEAR